MSLRKSFDSFAPQHKLWDAEEAYVQAVYRLRSAEEAYEQNVSDLKREMDFLFRKVEHYRHCLYAAKPLNEHRAHSDLQTVVHTKLIPHLSFACGVGPVGIRRTYDDFL